MGNSNKCRFEKPGVFCIFLFLEQFQSQYFHKIVLIVLIQEQRIFQGWRSYQRCSVKKGVLENFTFFFLFRIFFHGYGRLTGQQGKGGDYFLFHSTTSTRSRLFRHLFATLHVRWLSHVFNRATFIHRLYFHKFYWKTPVSDSLF